MSSISRRKFLGSSAALPLGLGLAGSAAAQSGTLTGSADMIEHIVELVERRAAEIEAAAEAEDEKSPAGGAPARPGKADVLG